MLEHGKKKKNTKDSSHPSERAEKKEEAGDCKKK
jgi:hypothetical protein